VNDVSHSIKIVEGEASESKPSLLQGAASWCGEDDSGPQKLQQNSVQIKTTRILIDRMIKIASEGYQFR